MSTSPYRLTIAGIEAAAQTIDPVFLNTPQFVSDSLSDALGTRLVLKVETLNPIRSFKGRGADLLVSRANAATHIVCASAGNFGQAIAYACRRRNMGVTIYASENANPLKIDRMRALGANVVLYGHDFDAAKLEARRMANESGARFVEDSLDIETLEGAGTIGLELLAFPEHIDVLIIALGNGAMINGIARIVKEKNPRMGIVAVQAKGAPAMVQSWQQKTVVTHDHVDTIADGIAVRIPVHQALLDMEGLVDDAVLVSDDAIIEGMRMLHRHVGVVAEPSGAVGIAALLENKSVYSGRTVATIVCGGNLTEAQMKRWL